MMFKVIAAATTRPPVGGDSIADLPVGTASDIRTKPSARLPRMLRTKIQIGQYVAKMNQSARLLAGTRRFAPGSHGDQIRDILEG